MWEVLSFGDKPYGEMSNQEVSLVFLTPPVLSPDPPQPFPTNTLIFFFLTFICIPILSGPLPPHALLSSLRPLWSEVQELWQ